jgi:hypothetical protein
MVENYKQLSSRHDYAMLKTLAKGVLAVVVIKFGATLCSVIAIISGFSILKALSADNPQVSPWAVTAGFTLIAFLLSLNIMQICLWCAKGLIIMSWRRILIFVTLCVLYSIATRSTLPAWKNMDFWILAFASIAWLWCSSLHARAVRGK